MTHRTPDTPDEDSRRIAQQNAKAWAVEAGWVDPVADTVQHERTQSMFPGYDPCGPDGLHRHDGEAAHRHNENYGREPHIHDPASGAVILIPAPATPNSWPEDGSQDGWFKPMTGGEDQPADPAPVVLGASADPQPRDGDTGPGRPRDTKGRFLARREAEAAWTKEFEDAVLEGEGFRISEDASRHLRDALWVLFTETWVAHLVEEKAKADAYLAKVTAEAPWYAGARVP